MLWPGGGGAERPACPQPALCANRPLQSLTMPRAGCAVLTYADVYVYVCMYVLYVRVRVPRRRARGQILLVVSRPTLY